MPQMVFGLGLGTLNQLSVLNEPYDGRVEILGVAGSDLEGTRVQLADEMQFERAKIRREGEVLKLRFKIVDAGNGLGYVQISSNDAMREPDLRFLLELSWMTGVAVREYAVSLRTRRGDLVQQNVLLPATATPASGVVAMPKVPAIPRAQPSHSVEPVLGPVGAKDTLWSLASANRPDDHTSVQQMMLALLLANPRAFDNDNINLLKRGAVLRIPNESEISAMSQGEAMAEIRRQYDLWNVSYSRPTGGLVEARLDEVPNVEQESVAETVRVHALERAADERVNPRLELVAPEGGDAAGAAPADDAFADGILAREELDAQVQENIDLRTRIAEANEIIALMSRQLDMKDDELAALQARLSGVGVSAHPDLVIDAEVSRSADAQNTAKETRAPSYTDIAVDFDDALGEEPDSAGSLLSGFIPQRILNIIPGGANTVFATLGLLLLIAFELLAKLFRGDQKEAHGRIVSEINGDEDLNSSEETEGADVEPQVGPEDSLGVPENSDTVSLQEPPGIREDSLEFGLSLHSSQLDELALSDDASGGIEPTTNDESESALEPTAEETLESREYLYESVVDRVTDSDLSDQNSELVPGVSKTGDGSGITPDEEESVLLPVYPEVDGESDASEIDTMLNLAKAYFELGDSDYARSILDQVVRVGSDIQQAEARRLIEQLT
tara:strand:- start:202 stop:2217 length:2016 start_codon:yes stop_codon:yes gene_type:complete